MSKLPAAITVGPFTYTVVVDQAAIDRAGQEVGDNLHGQCDSSKQTITLAPDLPPDLQADTVLHELLHAAVEHAGLGGQGPLGDHATEEQVVNALSPWLLGILRDNPQLVAHLTSTS